MNKDQKMVELNNKDANDITDVKNRKLVMKRLL